MAEGDIDDLLDEFRDAAIRYGNTTTEGEVRAHNRCVDELQRVRHELAACDREAALLDLFDDGNPWVQVCAADLSLEVDEAAALEKLRQIAAAGEPLLSLDAQTSLLYWEYRFYEGGPQTEKLYQEHLRKNGGPASVQELNLPEAMEKVEQLLAKVKKIPRTVRFKDIQGFKTMEDRFFAVDRMIGVILGMNADSIDFCPENKPPSRDEVLAWLWVIHPEYKAAIWGLGSQIVRKVILESEPE
jgi:hypothetical protein